MRKNYDYIKPEDIAKIPIVDITDSLISKYFYGSHYISKSKLQNIPANVKQYLDNRFNDCFSDKEAVVRIKFGIEEHPRCIICGAYLPFLGKQKKIFTDKVCSRSCLGKYNANILECKKGVRSTLRLSEVQEKTISTLHEHYGDNVNHNWQAKEVLNKCAYTTCERYYPELLSYFCTDTISPFQLQGVQRLINDKYFEEHGYYPLSEPGNNDNFRKAIHSAANKRLEETGYAWPIQNPNYNFYKYLGSDKHKQDMDSIIVKRVKTMKENGTMSKSTIEKEIEKYLTDNNVDYIAQHNSKHFGSNIYPWHCDFYLVKYDLWIEIQGFWSHGMHPFDESSEQDNIKLSNWKSKNSRFYNNCIKVWQISDPLKRQTATDNNLNYLEIFPAEGRSIITLDYAINCINDKLKDMGYDETI